MNISYKELIEDSKELGEKLPKDKYKVIYGIPNGGILPAFIIAKQLNIELISDLSEVEDKSSVLVVDDLIDSGETIQNLIKKYGGLNIAVVYKKKSSPKDISYTYGKEIKDEWINLPHEKDDERAVDVNIIRLLEFYNQKPNKNSIRRLFNILESIYK